MRIGSKLYIILRHFIIHAIQRFYVGIVKFQFEVLRISCALIPRANKLHIITFLVIQCFLIPWYEQTEIHKRNITNCLEETQRVDL